MVIKTKILEIKTRGNCDIVNITEHVSGKLREVELENGVITVFNVGSTAGITTIEYEPGLVNYDISAAFEKIAPKNGEYEHEKTWHDDNGHAHVRASLLGPSVSIPFVNGELTLGIWQQIVIIDFDTRARVRKIVLQFIGE
ncbi:MAG: YjbQ family protein [Planctomycetes bacterium]|nr:YjbQ family protein [Planctomycetota bacterium]MBL7106638.1 YjbQ family protein [Phycisphaerae bacterium]